MESTTTENTLSGSLGYIYDIPNYPWYLGCSPTASAMVLGYWDTHGYPDILVSSDEKPLIEELANAMENLIGHGRMEGLGHGILTTG